jgi:hypothetical protein
VKQYTWFSCRIRAGFYRPTWRLLSKNSALIDLGGPVKPVSRKRVSALLELPGPLHLVNVGHGQFELI